MQLCFVRCFVVKGRGGLGSRGGASGRMGLARGSGIVGRALEAVQLRVTSGNRCIPFLLLQLCYPGH
jgi:hypothetical protein